MAVAMVSRSEGFFVLYPAYFDARVTRAGGRRVPSAKAVSRPTSKAVFEAAKAAGLAPVFEDEHHHPSAWFERSGRVLIPQSSAKTKGDAIAKVAAQLPAAHAAIGERKETKPHHGPKGKFARKHRRRRH